MIDHKKFSTALLLLPLIHEGLFSLQVKVCAQSTGKPLSQSLPWKSVVRLTDRLDNDHSC